MTYKENERNKIKILLRSQFVYDIIPSRLMIHELIRTITPVIYKMIVLVGSDESDLF